MTETGKIGIRNYHLLSMLALGKTPSILVVLKVPTIILGMGALFGFPEQSDVPSIAAIGWGWRVSIQSSFDQVVEACKFLDEKWNPKDCGYCCTKNHHTKFFRQGSPDNALHGTVIDNKVCHPMNNDFYLGTHAGMIGITRQTDYHVLLVQAGFLADDLQKFVHSLSYMYQRSTTAIFVVAPICYAHLAAS
ncbi:hypothetical protein GOBAR_AA34476 [Gossypium barbadense]|uniref:Piwi domain-containing protein n=1 Tax=Gossypium barbadense TaxID=3634 RepID=A0A2P5W586_GOSBA|nr:hypothetical protein GOBAR_AA34476 [Gossypium barbadense]